MQGNWPPHILVWLSTRRQSFFLWRPRPPMLRRNAYTCLCNHSKEGKSSSDAAQLVSEAKIWINVAHLLPLTPVLRGVAARCKMPHANVHGSFSYTQSDWSLWRHPNSSVTDVTRSDWLKGNCTLTFPPPGTCLILSLEPHREVTWLKSSFLWTIWT